MSKTNIPEKVKLTLFGLAAGRCQYRGCNERLDVDDLTQQRMLNSCFAHIIADEPGGPRGDLHLSARLSRDLGNIMLLCPKHHKLVDVDNLRGHPVELLRRFKQEHEERVRSLTDIQPNLKTKLLFLSSMIGERAGLIEADEARRAILPLYPLDDGLHIDLTRSSVRDNEPGFWEIHVDEIKRQVRDRLGPQISSEAVKNVSVFALAPIPLLMVLGRTLGDVTTVNVFQKRRNPDSWQWDGPSTTPGRFVVGRPRSPAHARHVALLLSVSGTVQPDEATDALGMPPDAIWTIEADVPGVDFLAHREQLNEFGAHFRDVLTEIRKAHGPDSTVHVFPALPNSLAVEAGRLLLPKADPTLLVYDRNRDAPGFAYALALLEAPPSVASGLANG